MKNALYLFPALLTLSTMSFSMNSEINQEIEAIEQRNAVEQKSKVLSRCKNITESFWHNQFSTPQFQACTVLRSAPYLTAASAIKRAEKQKNNLNYFGKFFDKIGLLGKIYPMDAKSLFKSLFESDTKKFDTSFDEPIKELCEQFNVNDVYKEKLLYKQWYFLHGKINKTFDQQAINEAQYKFRILGCNP